MDNKNKIFFAVFFTLIVAVVAITFTKYFIAKDYYIEAQTDCDPYTEKCFVWKCDLDSPNEDERCTGNPEEDTWYYQKVRKIANEIPICDPDSEDCNALQCSPGMDCEVTYCNEDIVGEEQECNDPVKYTEENPVEEEDGPGEECVPDDEECIISPEVDSAGDEDNEKNIETEKKEIENSAAEVLNFMS